LFAWSRAALIATIPVRTATVINRIRFMLSSLGATAISPGPGAVGLSADPRGRGVVRELQGVVGRLKAD